MRDGSKTKTPGSKTFGSKTLGSKTLGSKTLGSKTLGSKTPGSKTPGSKTLGTDIPRPTHVFWQFLFALTIASLIWAFHALAADQARSPCIDDAMIVFDASGSMSGNRKLGLATSITRIDEVRDALASALPLTNRSRRIGLITYGPGPYNQCNVEVKLRPVRNAATRIMSEVDRLIPAGKTPLTEAVEQAATILDYRERPGVVVVLTDGEETCEGSPCALGKRLRAEANHLVVHVIAFRSESFSWTGEHSRQEAKCLAETNNGLYISADTKDELIAAFKKTLACPMLSGIRHHG